MTTRILLPLGRAFIVDAEVSRRLGSHASIFGAAGNILDDRYTVARTPITNVGPPTLSPRGIAPRVARKINRQRVCLSISDQQPLFRLRRPITCRPCSSRARCCPSRHPKKSANHRPQRPHPPDVPRHFHPPPQIPSRNLRTRRCFSVLHRHAR